SKCSFPTQRLVFTAQIFQTFADIELFLAILLLHSLWNLFGFRALDSVWGEATLFVHRNIVGELRLVVSVLRDTPHARVSVSYVLEASLLNDRVQRKSGGKYLEANSHARFLGRKYST